MRRIIALLFAAITLGYSVASALPQPATIRFVRGHAQDFWITNNSDQTLAFILNKIEVKSDSNWTTYWRPVCGVVFFKDTHNHPIQLAPHEAAYGNLGGQVISFPNSGVWRASLLVEEPLTDAESAETSKGEASGKETHSSAKGSLHFGHSRQIYSEPVSS